MLIISINKTGEVGSDSPVTSLLPAWHIMPPVNERSRAGRLRQDHPVQCHRLSLTPVHTVIYCLSCQDQVNCKVLQRVISISRHLDDCLTEVKLKIDMVVQFVSF